jgi:uncharacterized protein
VTDTIPISAQTARRFVLGKQGLWPGRRWSGKAGTSAAITACEHLQLDPLVIVARSHDLMLHSRVDAYRPELFDELAYAERSFFDWGGWLAVRPMRELPYWRVLMHRNRDLAGQRHVVEHHAAAIDEMRALLRDGATVSGREFDAAERVAVSNYRGRKDSSLALYYLWRVGEAMTHHRERFERVYAAAESVAPPALLEPVDERDADRFMARKQIAFAGIGRVGPLSKTLARTVTKHEQRDIEDELVDAGDIVAVEVEGWRGVHFVLADDVEALRAVDAGRIPPQWAPLDTSTHAEVTLLSPLDPVSARGRAKSLFDFDYVWEIYKRPEDVQFGRYTLPMLWGDELVGRVDLKLDRQANALVVNGAWLERPATAAAPDFLDAFAAGMRRMLGFLGTDRIDASAVTQRRLRAPLTALNPRRRKRPA